MTQVTSLWSRAALQATSDLARWLYQLGQTELNTPSTFLPCPLSLEANELSIMSNLYTNQKSFEGGQ